MNGTLAPSGTLPIIGNLAFTSSGTSVHNVTPQSADRVDVKAVNSVGGLLQLNGHLSVNITGTFTPSPVVIRYTLLEAQSGFVFGYTMFTSMSINYPTDQGFTPEINYDSTHVYLDLNFH